MKKITITSLLLSTILSLSGCATNETSTTTNTSDQNENITTANNNTSFAEKSNSNASVTTTTYTETDVAMHIQKENCWVIISGKVYDVTLWEDKHPGGKEAILRNCGKDISKLSDTHKGGGFDSPKLQEILKKFYKGDLKH